MNEQRSFTGTGGGGGDATFQMWRRTTQGDLDLVDVEFNDYAHPPKGKQGRFRLNGWSPYYESEGIYGLKTRTRAEYLILKMPSAREFEGKLFSQQFPIPKNIDNEKAVLGQFLSALLNRPIREGETVNIDDFISTEFVTTTTRDESGDKVYCGIAWNSIDPDKTKLSAFLNRAAPEPALMGAEEDADDPFAGAEDDL